MSFSSEFILIFPNVVQVPARIEKLIAEKQFYAAVQLHAQSVLMLEREGLQTVGFVFVFSFVTILLR